MCPTLTYVCFVYTVPMGSLLIGNFLRSTKIKQSILMRAEGEGQFGSAINELLVNPHLLFFFLLRSRV